MNDIALIGLGMACILFLGIIFLNEIIKTMTHLKKRIDRLEAKQSNNSKEIKR
jgi:hypothetical protein